MPRYHVTLDERDWDVEVTPAADHFDVRINGRPVTVRNHNLSESRSLLLINNESFEVDIRFDEANGGKVVFRTGHEIPATVEDYNLAQMRKTAGFDAAVAVEEVLRAPMPGLIVSIPVAPGQRVEKGTPLVVVEAMKMENVIKAKHKATVKTVLVAEGQSVEKGDRLLEFE